MKSHEIIIIFHAFQMYTINKLNQLGDATDNPFGLLNIFILSA